MSFAGQPIDDLLLSKVSDKIGSIAQSMLEPVAFNEDNPGTWLLMNGQTCSGSAYQTATGHANVANMYSDGAFLRQAKPGRSKSSYEDMDYKGFYMQNPSSGSYTHNAVHMKSTTAFQGNPFGGYWAGPGGRIQVKFDTSEIRPKNIACNFYIKVDY